MNKFRTDRELCKIYARELSNGFYEVELEGFSEACFDQNSEEELREALNGNANRSDCDNWGISEQQWRESIEMALAARLIVENDDQLPE